MIASHGHHKYGLWQIVKRAARDAHREGFIAAQPFGRLSSSIEHFDSLHIEVCVVARFASIVNRVEVRPQHVRCGAFGTNAANSMSRDDWEGGGWGGERRSADSKRRNPANTHTMVRVWARRDALLNQKKAHNPRSRAQR